MSTGGLRRESSSPACYRLQPRRPQPTPASSRAISRPTAAQSGRLSTGSVVRRTPKTAGSIASSRPRALHACTVCPMQRRRVLYGSNVREVRTGCIESVAAPAAVAARRHKAVYCSAACCLCVYTHSMSQHSHSSRDAVRWRTGDDGDWSRRSSESAAGQKSKYQPATGEHWPSIGRALLMLRFTSSLRLTARCDFV